MIETESDGLLELNSLVAASEELILGGSITTDKGSKTGISDVLAPDIPVFRLGKLLSSFELPEGGAIHLFHQSGKIVLSTEKDSGKLSAVTGFIVGNTGVRRSFIRDYSGSGIFYDSVPVGNTGFFSVVTVPGNSLDRGIIPIRVAAFSASCMLALLAAALLVYLRFYYRKRIKVLASYFSRVGESDGTLEVIFEGNDEFGFLNLEFNRIVERTRQAEKAGMDSERKYRNIVESAPVGIFRSTETGQFESVNARLAEILGYASPEDLLSVVKNIGTQLYADPVERGRFLDHLKQSGSVSNHVIRNRRKDGEIVWLSLNSKMVPGSEGEMLFDGFITDVTETVKDKERLRDLAETDVLSGIRNRRYFMAATDRELERQARYGYDVSLLLLDIDHFKHVNDTWGHDGGDKVLVGLVRTVETCVRHTDLFARLGGEEFVILMPETGTEGACTIAERIRLSVENDLRVMVDTDSVKVTVSIGVASVMGAMTTDDLVKRADSAMYAAKNSGRNRVSVFKVPL